ncbi:hypothetical protein F4778DRAFT_37470 [Xylariomycetidae sp. FL2044]|nr:hypothetical protein F4778DRAFT_37470 [Xylariomycetidae sp. FL2044]
MPHKHTRRERDFSTFDLPPSQIAKPLPVKSQSQKDNAEARVQDKAPRNLKRKRNVKDKDDAPRAFKRLMALADGKKPRSGLDDGLDTGRNKRNTKSAQRVNVGKDAKQTTEVPTIRTGERMSEFAARVDAALPLSGLINNSVKGNKDPLGLKVWRTKKERKMHQMYDEWREEERKIKEKREEELEMQAEKDLEDEENGVAWKLDSAGGRSGKKNKKAKRARLLDEVGDVEEDPWEVLKKNRGETRAGLHDVVQAPPEFGATGRPKRALVRGAAVEVDNIPKSAGSLRRREELQTIRDDIVASYRKRMSDKRFPTRES